MKVKRVSEDIKIRPPRDNLVYFTDAKNRVARMEEWQSLKRGDVVELPDDVVAQMTGLEPAKEKKTKKDVGPVVETEVEE